MQITFEFNEDHHAFRLIPDDDLEQQVLAKMAEGSAKGKSVTLSKLTTDDVRDHDEFRVEIKVNGK